MTQSFSLSTTVPAANTITAASKTYFVESLYIPICGDGQYCGYERGMSANFRGYGLITTGAVPGTLTMGCDYYANSGGSGTVTLDSTTGITPPASLTAAGFSIEGQIVFGVTGSSGLAQLNGKLEIQSSANVPFVQYITNSGNGTSGYVSVNTVIATGQYLRLWNTWGSTGNSITMNSLQWERKA